MLTGIHPIKLLRQLTERFGAAEAERLFREKYFGLGGKWRRWRRGRSARRRRSRRTSG